MEKEQIVKALECCSSEGCETCPCSRMPTAANCVLFTMGNALSLIREQEKRIEELETSCTELTQNLHACKASTVRKMQEMLKAKEYTNNYCQEIVLVDDIDQIAKQLLEENT